MQHRQHTNQRTLHNLRRSPAHLLRRLSSLLRSRPVAATARALAGTGRDFVHNDYLTHAAALAFFFFLALFPLLMFLAATLAYVPVPHLFDRILNLLAVVAPPNAMGVVRAVLRDTSSRPAELLSIGIAGAVVSSSGGFSAMITALNIAYDVPEDRPLWKKALLSVGLTLLTGIGTIVALLSIALGPRFGFWLASHLHGAAAFAVAWPYLRWLLITLITVLSVESIYFVAPNVRQRFLAQIPGAALAVFSWVAASWALNWYLRSFAQYNYTFGALGAVAALMLWLYLSALAIILGAELNSELLKSHGHGLPRKHSPHHRNRQAPQKSP